MMSISSEEGGGNGSVLSKSVFASRVDWSTEMMVCLKAKFFSKYGTRRARTGAGKRAVRMCGLTALAIEVRTRT